MRGMEYSNFEPDSWLVVFHEKSSVRWVNRLVWGRFKHVSAVAWFEAARVWVLFDPALPRIQIVAMPENIGAEVVGGMIDNAGVLRIRTREGFGSVGGRLGLWCVPAVKHLLGLRCGALRPDALWNHCVADGAEVMSHGHGKHVSTERG